MSITNFFDRVIPAYSGTNRGEGLGVELDEQECIRQLNERGFEPAFIGDLRVGDIWIKEPERFPYNPEATMIHVVERVLPVDRSYYDDESNDLIHNVVVNMVVYSEDGNRRHMTYGSTHGVYIFRGSV